MPGGEGMAPLTERRWGDARRDRVEGLRILRRVNLELRQNGDGQGRNGNNRGGGDGGGFGGRNGGGNGGGGGGGGGGDNGGNGRGGGGFGGGGFGRNRGGNNDDSDDDGGDSGRGRFRGGNRGGFGRGRFGGGGGGNNNDGGDGGGEAEGPPAPTSEASAPPPETTAAPSSSSAPPEVTTSAEPPPAPEPTTVVQVSTMIITPPAADPTTVTALVPLMTADPAAVLAGSTDNPTILSSSDIPSSSSAPAGTQSSETSAPSPAPTAFPDQGTDPLALSTALGTTSVESDSGIVVGTSILGDVPSSTADSNVATGAAAPVATDTPQGMDPVAERAMISVGSIAAFVMVVSIVWLVFRRVKRKGGSGRGGGSGSRFFSKILPRRLARKLPSSPTKGLYEDRGWEKIGETVSIRDRPPTYSSKSSGAKSVPLGGFYGHEKAYPFKPSEAKRKEEKPRLPRLQTKDIPAEPRPTSRTASSARPLSSHPVNAMRVSRGNVSANTTTPSTAVLFSHQTQDSFSSTNAAQFGSVTAVSSATTARSKMGLGYYNQSEMARTPSTAYDPQRRQVNRASELSSISSGFGDGDIIVTTNNSVPVPQIPPNVHTNAPPQNPNPRFSWMSQEPNKRDTVYTQSSEDMPPRFRSVTSWVDQQTGRIKRAQQRERSEANTPPVPHVPGQAGIPGIHNPPGEQGYEMMMDDEKPRPVELPVTIRR